MFFGLLVVPDQATSIPLTKLVAGLMRIDLSCAECGQNDFRLDQVNDPLALIECRECGHLVGTLQSLQERVVEQLRQPTQRAT
jgi:Zn ribbon nucleic-acid-binding protein